MCAVLEWKLLQLFLRWSYKWARIPGLKWHRGLLKMYSTEYEWKSISIKKYNVGHLKCRVQSGESLVYAEYDGICANCTIRVLCGCLQIASMSPQTIFIILLILQTCWDNMDKQMNTVTFLHWISDTKCSCRKQREPTIWTVGERAFFLSNCVYFPV